MACKSCLENGRKRSTGYGVKRRKLYILQFLERVRPCLACFLPPGSRRKPCAWCVDGVRSRPSGIALAAASKMSGKRGGLDYSKELSSSPLTFTEGSAHKRFRIESPAPESVAHECLTDHESLMSSPLTVVIFGATGDLAKKKLFPSLYQLTLQGRLPRDLNIVGYGRSKVDLTSFIEKQCVNIVEDDSWPKEDFCSRIQFHAGAYDSPESFASLSAEMLEYENAHASGKPGNRLFFLSVPPTVFGTVAEMISSSARAEEGGFTRLMIEKPFGRDTASFEELNVLTSRHFHESQLFRLDHYLGKEVILNISTLRWANVLFEPLWSCQNIESVMITFKEDIGCGGRGGYFDGFGIIRDIIQNHLLQAFMFLAMEPPTEMSGPAITAAKIELLRAVSSINPDDSRAYFLGQFGPGTKNGEPAPGYLEDQTVPEGSRCPTFAACVLHVDNERWRGVPFLLSAGKGLDERLCEFRIRFKGQPYQRLMGDQREQNELVMRVQPDEALYMVAVAKHPGISPGLGREERRTPVAMGLRYATQFGDGSPFVSGDAYERMLLNAARGDQALSVSAAELTEAWRIFTPMLHKIDQDRPQPIVHPFGACWPEGYDSWAGQHGVDVHPLRASWGAKEAEEKLQAQLAAHRAAVEAASRPRRCERSGGHRAGF